MLDKVKLALRLTVNDYDEEIQLLIDDCRLEMQGLGIWADDAQTDIAIIAYCKWKFGNNSDAERWAAIYRDKIEKLMSMNGYGLGGGDYFD